MTIRSHAATFGLAAILVGPGAYAAQSTWTLTKVTFQGNTQVPTSELQAALPIQPGDTIDKAGAQDELDAIGSVYKKHNVGVGISQRMSAQGKKASITYILTEQAPTAPTVVHIGITVDSVSVTGNSRVPTSAILAAANIPVGSQISNDKIAAAQSAITALYKKKNVGASVATDWTYPQPQHVAMVFKITEQSE
jgi:outer membrane protein assembly factor BamA